MLISRVQPSGSRRRRTLFAALAITALSLTTTAVSASSALADPTPQSCWTDVDTGAVQCFDADIDPSTAIEDATGTTVVAVPTGEEGETFGTESTDDTFLLATVYDGTNMGAPSMSYSTSNSNICIDTYSFSSLGSWNDRIESLQGFNGCRVDLYQDINFGTLIFGPSSVSTDVGAGVRNQASSLQIG